LIAAFTSLRVLASRDNGESSLAELSSDCFLLARDRFREDVLQPGFDLPALFGVSHSMEALQSRERTTLSACNKRLPGSLGQEKNDRIDGCDEHAPDQELFQRPATDQLIVT
jgi:hypothetical protein